MEGLWEVYDTDKSGDLTREEMWPLIIEIFQIIKFDSEDVMKKELDEHKRRWNAAEGSEGIHHVGQYRREIAEAMAPYYGMLVRCGPRPPTSRRVRVLPIPS